MRVLADRRAGVEAELLHITCEETYLRKQQRRLLHGILAAKHGVETPCLGMLQRFHRDGRPWSRSSPLVVFQAVPIAHGVFSPCLCDEGLPADLRLGPSVPFFWFARLPLRTRTAARRCRRSDRNHWTRFLHVTPALQPSWLQSCTHRHYFLNMDSVAFFFFLKKKSLLVSKFYVGPCALSLSLRGFL